MRNRLGEGVGADLPRRGHAREWQGLREITGIQPQPVCAVSGGEQGGARYRATSRSFNRWWRTGGWFLWREIR